MSAATAGSATCYFTIDVPQGQMALKVEENTGTSTDRYLAVKFGSPPGTWDTDCKDADPGKLTCDIANPSAGRWWIAVSNYYTSDTSTDPFTITATYLRSQACGTKGTPHVLRNDSQENAVGASQTFCYYTIEIPFGQSSFDVVAASTTGIDTDVYVNNAPWPEAASGSMCADSGPGASATCRLANPTAGTWWIAVIDGNKAHQSPVSFTVKATYDARTPVAQAGDFQEDQLGSLEPSQSNQGLPAWLSDIIGVVFGILGGILGFVLIGWIVMALFSGSSDDQSEPADEAEFESREWTKGERDAYFRGYHDQPGLSVGQEIMYDLSQAWPGMGGGTAEEKAYRKGYEKRRKE